MKEQTPEEQAEFLIRFYGEEEAKSIVLKAINEAEKEIYYWRDVLSELE